MCAFLLAIGLIAAAATTLWGQGVVLPGSDRSIARWRARPFGAPLELRGPWHLESRGHCRLAELGDHVWGGIPLSANRCLLDGSRFRVGDRCQQFGRRRAAADGHRLSPGRSLWSYGLGIYTIGGFGANFPANPSNPIFSAPPPNGVGAVRGILGVIADSDCAHGGVLADGQGIDRLRARLSPWPTWASIRPFLPRPTMPMAWAAPRIPPQRMPACTGRSDFRSAFITNRMVRGASRIVQEPAVVRNLPVQLHRRAWQPAAAGAERRLPGDLLARH